MVSSDKIESVLDSMVYEQVGSGSGSHDLVSWSGLVRVMIIDMTGTW